MYSPSSNFFFVINTTFPSSDSHLHQTKFQVKATYEGKTKFVEFERKESTSHANLESKLKAALSISALAKIDLLFKPDSGMNQGFCPSAPSFCALLSHSPRPLPPLDRSSETRCPCGKRSPGSFNTECALLEHLHHSRKSGWRAGILLTCTRCVQASHVVQPFAFGGLSSQALSQSICQSFRRLSYIPLFHLFS